jgi:hypothetical protein
MYRSLCGLIIGLLVSTSCFAQQSLVGTYKLVSFTVEVDGQPPRQRMGKSPRGYAILTPTRWMNIFTAEDRKFGTSVEDQAALWDSLITYSGTYRLEGEKFITSVDVSWNERWNGTKQVRYWQLDGSRLTITTEQAPSSRDPSRMQVVRAVFDKIE